MAAVALPFILSVAASLEAFRSTECRLSSPWRAACNITAVVCIGRGEESKAAFKCAKEHGSRKWLLQTHQMARWSVAARSQPVSSAVIKTGGKSVRRMVSA